MEKIHHQHTKRAEKMGVTLTPEPEYSRVVAFWPAHNLRIYGADARYAIQQMIAAQKIIQEHADHSIKIVNDPVTPWNVQIIRNGQLLDGTMPPIMWAEEELMDHIPTEEYPGKITDPGETSGPNSGMQANEASDGSWERTGKREVPPQFEEEHGVPDFDQTGQIKSLSFIEDEPLTINGVPTNGRMAHQKGFTIPDCPYNAFTDSMKCAKWEEEWEASAEESLDKEVSEAEGEKEPEKPGSVVKTKYRAIYAERGHPTHCGDELAVKLNNLVLDGSHCNIEYFKMILDANNVDMTKYRTTGNGWQGRYRMTGRNKLAKVVHSNKGLLKLPNGMELQMSQEWIAAQRFK